MIALRCASRSSAGGTEQKRSHMTGGPRIQSHADATLSIAAGISGGATGGDDGSKTAVAPPAWNAKPSDANVFSTCDGGTAMAPRTRPHMSRSPNALPEQ